MGRSGGLSLRYFAGRRIPWSLGGRLLANLRATAPIAQLQGLKRRPATDCSRQRSFIEVVQFAANRHAVCQSRDLDLGVVKEVGDVVGGALPVEGRIQR